MYTERHVFEGSNTYKGFFSYFDYIIDLSEADRVYILKGGPGVGKSSLMKKFAKAMANRGYFIEYIHCSSDEDSLDGVKLPELKTVILDGTAPHTVDPRLPGAADEIINLGAYLDGNRLKKGKEQINIINKAKAALYKSAYRYIGAANKIMEEIDAFYDRLTDETKYRKLCRSLSDRLLPHGGIERKPGTMRKLFADTYTAGGHIDYSSTLHSDYRLWALTGACSDHASRMLSDLALQAVARGFYVEGCYNPVNPEKLKHLIIPDLNIMLLSAESGYSYKYDDVIDMMDVSDAAGLKEGITEIEGNLHLYDIIMKSAVGKLAEAKKQHELLELFYTNAMDFTGNDACLEVLLERYE